MTSLPLSWLFLTTSPKLARIVVKNIHGPGNAKLFLTMVRGDDAKRGRFWLHVVENSHGLSEFPGKILGARMVVAHQHSRRLVAGHFPQLVHL